MIRAPQLQWPAQQADACVTPRWSGDAAGEARGPIKFDASRRETPVTDIPREMPARAFSRVGAAS